ncbi:MAG: CYTH domain-containing protein [Chloroflexota bacterium]|nr:CYTH domain-containing protein [Chloroflexota bacterium]
MPIEVESKFRAANQLVLQRLSTVDHLGPGRLGEPAVARDLDRYLDTADRRLAGGGWACRLRTRGDRTILSLKGTAAALGDGSGLHRRPEIEGPATTEIAPDAWPASEARDVLMQLTGGARLEERLHLDQRRTERPVVVEGHRVATLSLDEVDVLDPAEGSLGRLLVVELEHAGSAREDELVAVAAALEAEPGLTPDPLTKLELASQLIDSRAREG